MADLFSEYFRRDLSDREMDQLEAWLQGPQENAQRFSDEAAGFYRSLGLPEGRLSGSGLGPLLGSSLGLIMVAVAAWLVWPGAQAPLPLPRSPDLPALKPMPTAPSSPEFVPRAKPKPRLKAPPRQAFVTPGPGGDGKKFDAFSVTVNLPDRREDLVVRVLDEQGTEVRVLYRGALEKGSWDFPWDGRLETGPAGPGHYSIEVRSGGTAMTKQIRVEKK